MKTNLSPSADAGRLSTRTSTGTATRTSTPQAQERAARDRYSRSKSTTSASKPHSKPGGIAHTMSMLFSAPGQLAKAAAVAGTMLGTVGMPGVAQADFVGIDATGSAVIVQSEQAPQILPGDQISEPPFDPDQLESYPLFQLFWDSEVEGTSMNGVWSLSPKGVAALLELAEGSTLNGEPLPDANTAGPKPVSAGHRELVKFILEDPHYQAFIAQESVPLLRLAFDLSEAQVDATDNGVTDAGEIRFCSSSEWWGTAGLNQWPVRDIPRAFDVEYKLGADVGRYEGAGTTTETKKYELGCLLKQFSDGLNRLDDLALPREDQVRHQLQDQLLGRFFALPAFDESVHGEVARDLRQHFATDFNGTGMGLAQSIVKGFDPNNFVASFPNANDRRSPVSLSMSTSNLKDAMRELDSIREARGLNARAQHTKKQPALAYIFGELPGHDKKGLDERRPFSSGLERFFGTRIEFGSSAEGFERSEIAAKLPPKSGFNFPMDLIWANGNAISASGSSKIEVFEAGTTNRVDVELVVHNNLDGEPKDWSARFFRADGAELEPEKVIGRVRVGGRLQGDGKANQELETGYWGMCDDNTGANIIFGRYSDLPTTLHSASNDGKVWIRNGDGLYGVPAQRGLELLYMDLPAIGGTEYPDNAGYRYGYDSSELRWSRGGVEYTNFGRIEGLTLKPGAQSNHDWVGNDTIRVHNTNDEPLNGLIRLENANGKKTYVEASLVSHVAMLPNDEVRVFYQDGKYGKSVSGEALTELNLDWNDSTLVSEDIEGVQLWKEDAKMGDTLESFFDQYAAGSGVSFEQFLAANPELAGRPAESVRANESIRLPAFTTTYTVQEGDTLSSLEESLLAALHMSTHQLRRDNEGLPSEPDVALEPGRTLELRFAGKTVSHRGETLRTLQEVYENEYPNAPFDLEALRAANPKVTERAENWLDSRDRPVIPHRVITIDQADPLPGDFKMVRDDGVEIVVRPSEVDYIQGETPHDVPFTHYMRFVERSLGVFGTDASLRRGISNGRKWVTDIATFEAHGNERPEWVKEDVELAGRHGPLVRQPGDKVVFASGSSTSSRVFSGWYQVDKSTGRVLNEGFTSGEPDFAWGTVAGGLNWNARSTYIGDAMPTDVRLGLIVNGIEALQQDSEEADAVANRLELPSNWRSYRVSDEEIEAHQNAEN